MRLWEWGGQSLGGRNPSLEDLRHNGLRLDGTRLAVLGAEWPLAPIFEYRNANCAVAARCCWARQSGTPTARQPGLAPARPQQ